MNKVERTLVLLVLFTVLSLGLMCGAMVDVVNETRKTRSELEREQEKVAQLKIQLEEETKKNEERMTLLDAHVQYFISGGWK